MSGELTSRCLPLSGLRLIERSPICDNRGSLERLYSIESMGKLGFQRSISQINITNTLVCGTVRGMHFQKSWSAEDKIVTCLRGVIFDVVVDLRRGSPTFLNWHGEILDSKQSKSLLIPIGFAHGFQTMADDCQVLYFHNAPYSRGNEDGLRPTDPKLGIEWPLQIKKISDRDARHKLIGPDFEGFFL